MGLTGAGAGAKESVTGASSRCQDRSARPSGAEHSKDGEPRAIPLVGELRDVIEGQRERREYKTETGETALSRFVFHREGQPIGDFREAWAAGCIAAGFSAPKLARDGQPVLPKISDR